MARSSAARGVLIALGIILILGGSCAGLVSLGNVRSAGGVAVLVAAVVAVVGGVFAIVKSGQ